MRNIGKIIYFILMILLPYTFIIYFFPVVGENVDEFTGTKINSKFRDGIIVIIEKIGDTKDSTNNLIDGVGSNAKSKTAERNNNINEILNQ